MKIGVRAHDYGKHTPYQLGDIIREAGFETVQLVLPKAIQGIDSLEHISQSQLEEITEAFREKNIRIPILGCYINPALPNEKEREEQLQLFFKAIEYATVLKAPLVGTETTLFNEYEENREKAFNILLDSVLRLVERADKLGINVGVEPVKEHTLNSPDLTYKLIEKVATSNLKIIFDPVNLLSIDRIENQNEKWEECLQAFGNQIAILHMKDIVVRKMSIEETILGEGLVDYTRIIKWLKTYKSEVSIIREGAKIEAAKQEIEFIKRMIKS